MSRLMARGMNVDQCCPMCEEGEETTAHTLLFSPAASSIWRHSALRLDTRAFDADGFRGWCNLMYGKIKETNWWDIFWCLAWGIWLKRNAWVLDKREKREADILYVGCGDSIKPK